MNSTFEPQFEAFSDAKVYSIWMLDGSHDAAILSN
jgi:hypothetical protein